MQKSVAIPVAVPRLNQIACASGGRPLESRQVGLVAATATRPQLSQWIIATDGFASPPSPDAPGSAGWGFVIR